MYKKFVSLLLFSTLLHGKDHIEIYNHFGNTAHIIIEGSLLHKKKYSKVDKEDGIIQNFWRKIKRFKNDEIKNQNLTATISGHTYTTKSDDEGYFKFDITLKTPLKQGYEPISLQIKEHNFAKKVEVPILSQKAVGIISDFDDTVIVSDVTNKLKLTQNLFLKNYKQRELIPTMRERFQKILETNPKEMPTPLFFVTGSPQQLSSSITEFLQYHHFPPHIIITKKIHGYDTDPLLDQFAYKVAEIETIFTLYPNLEWVFFGDSGEKDEEVYRYLAEQYPSKIKSFYIRDVKSGDIIKKK